MYEGRRVVVCVPSGRERFLRVLLPYLLSPRASAVDEVHLWVNTDVESDKAYISKLAAEHSKVQSVTGPGRLLRTAYNRKREHFQYNNSVSRFYVLTTEPNTVYFKVDDDVCYVHPSFFTNACADLLSVEKTHFCVLANAVNVPLTTKLYQEAGVISEEHGKSTGDARCPVACESGQFAKRLHEEFLQLHSSGSAEKLFFKSFSPEGRRQRIGAMAYTGETFALFGGRVLAESDEKEFTWNLPNRLKMPLWVCGSALVSHFAFSHQLAVLEDESDLLERYRKLATAETGIEL